MIDDVRSPSDDIASLKKTMDNMELVIKALAEKVNEIVDELNKLEGVNNDKDNGDNVRNNLCNQ